MQPQTFQKVQLLSRQSTEYFPVGLHPGVCWETTLRDLVDLVSQLVL